VIALGPGWVTAKVARWEILVPDGDDVDDLDHVDHVGDVLGRAGFPDRLAAVSGGV
jgi:hypothetical protein